MFEFIEKDAKRLTLPQNHTKENFTESYITDMDYLNLSFYTWPGNNTWLNEGLVWVLSSLSYLHYRRTNNIVFIDISIFSFHSIVSEKWLTKFKKSNLIFLCDAQLAPLANYCYLRMRMAGFTGGVIYSFDDLHEVKRKISLVISGYPVPPQRELQKISIKEFNILKLLYQGVNIKKIATICNTTTKTIYVHKSAIERKLKTSIKRIPWDMSQLNPL
ncbi:LuxR C-terminal-related transcriptional regulator [Trabulsiella odontotermitis]|uniref:LuxR C-terminal-related transcriptional regulator n=1 Tax=Trabulsiella odontotermitis TaxID=379893 RepID=UPI000676A4E5|nr:LuxR C-terminal-related transcriptional regulator [Trabulsiella odontotermitis]KNC89215.1 hypothetical protein GM30_09115 [Trabulsiella odontotermitis]